MLTYVVEVPNYDDVAFNYDRVVPNYGDEAFNYDDVVQNSAFYWVSRNLTKNCLLVFCVENLLDFAEFEFELFDNLFDISVRIELRFAFDVRGKRCHFHRAECRARSFERVSVAAYLFAVSLAAELPQICKFVRRVFNKHRD